MANWRTPNLAKARAVLAERGWTSKHRENHRLAMEKKRGVPRLVSVRERISQTETGKQVSPETKQRMSDSAKARWADKVTRMQQAEMVRRLWQEPEYVVKQMRANNVQPNKLELEVEAVLEPLGFRYVGDGQLIVGGKCPDFWDGGTRLVELYGDYWHRGQDPQERIDHFARHGYECRVVWEHEVRDGLLVAL